MKGYKRIVYIGMIVIALGITLSTALSEDVRPIGIVFIAIGGLLFISGMNRKKEEDANKNKGDE